jgi:hypothetical protein
VIPVVIDRGMFGSMVGIGIVAIVAILSIAISRRRRRTDDDDSSHTFAQQLDALRDELGAREAASDARLARIEQMIEVLAVEVERVGEGQRFVSKLLANDRPAS